MTGFIIGVVIGLISTAYILYKFIEDSNRAD